MVWASSKFSYYYGSSLAAARFNQNLLFFITSGITSGIAGKRGVLHDVLGNPFQ